MKRRIRKSVGIRNTGKIRGESDGWQLLADSIILQAVRDFRSHARMIKSIRKRLNSRKYTREEKDFQIERLRLYERKLDEDKDFFFSDWFSTLTELDGYDLLCRLDKEVET